MTRIFLGWDTPALPRAAAHLIEHYLDGAVADLRGATLVLPGRRARRRIIELLLDAAEARGATLIPPVATTVGSLPGLLYASPKPAAGEIASRRAWSRALRSVDRAAVASVFPHLPQGDGLAGWDELAGLLAGLHESLAGEGHRFADVVSVCRSGVLFDDGDRWEALARVEARYLEVLAEAGLADRFEARLAALESHVEAFPGELWLISIVEIPAVTRRLVEASGAEVTALIHAPEALEGAFDPFGLPSTDYWETARVPVTDQVLSVVERPIDQADAVIDALAALGGSHSAEDVVLGVHAESGVVPTLEPRLEAAGVSPRYAAGTPLSRTGPVRLLEAVADYVESRSFEALAALIRHPDAAALPGPAQAADGALAAADAYFPEHLPFRVHGKIPKGRRGAAASFPRLIHAIQQDGPLRNIIDNKKLTQPLIQWMPSILDLLIEVYGTREWDRSKPAQRRVLDSLGEIRSVAAALASLPASLDEDCTGSAAIRGLLVELRGRALPPEPRRDAVELLDWLEVPLDDAPVAILTAFNEGFLPASVTGHAFLPDALRTRLGLLDNRSRIARDAYRLTTVLHSKDIVRLIAGRRSAEGDPLRPSRLMFRIPEEDMPARVLQFLKRDGGSRADRATGDAGGIRGSNLAALGLTPGTRSQFAVPPEPVIELGWKEVPDRLSVTDFRRLLADPYRFVLERVYGLDSVEDTARELDALGFGSLAHDVLHRFGLRALASPPEVDVTDASDVTDTLAELLDREVATRFGANAMPAVALQAEQLKTRLRAFAGKQAAWAAEGWRIVAVECQAEGDGVPFEVDGTDMLLRGRIDRIDHNASTGEWAVLDYKTGNSVDAPDKTHRKGSGDDRPWIDLQLPLYRLLVGEIVDARGRVRVGYVSLPKKAEDSEFMLAPWSEADFAGAEEAARAAIRGLREGRFKFDPTVTKPSWFGGDPLEPLISVGWQAADEEDEG